ncbi:hypothetical protein D7X33_12630 [Butyricicoccus sp. 1XD8-22]|nr:hypothetical protein D7X33_12630 [Butyricicoccus sp. 1XD8-22]
MKKGLIFSLSGLIISAGNEALPRMALYHPEPLAKADGFCDNAAQEVSAFLRISGGFFHAI